MARRLSLPRPAAVTVRRLALASLVANLAIVVTGGAVRLTASGLGCPTWPRCTTNSFVTTAELGAHGRIEFGNRLFTYVLVGVALATLVAAVRFRPVRRDWRRLAAVLFLGIPAQAVLGGITVLTGLNPWVVTGHFLLSMLLVGLATLLVRRTGEPAGGTRLLVPPSVHRLSLGVLGALALVLWLGTVLTGSGPHAGDAAAPRTGLDPMLLTRLHGAGVAVLVALTVALTALLRSGDAPSAARRAARVLLLVELAQGAVGFAQYATGLPRPLVGLHLLGAGLLVVAVVRVVLTLRAPAAAGRSTPVRAPEPSETSGAAEAVGAR